MLGIRIANVEWFLIIDLLKQKLLLELSVSCTAAAKLNF